MSGSDQEAFGLLEFLYACPVGLVEFDRSGAIKIINPHAMKHLLPLASGRGAGNLFTILEGCAPEVRNLVDAFAPDTGTICDAHRITVDLGRGAGGADPKTLACTIVRLAADRFIATITDITLQIVQERRLRQAETWFGSLLSGINDYAVLTLLPDGRIESVNACFARQTGRDDDRVVGSSLDTIITTDSAMGAPSLIDQLRIAEREGWALDESWQTRLNGERYWCQRLIAACRGKDGLSLTGYTVVLRDVVPQASDTGLLRRMLTEDDLTGAANRAHFSRLLERELRRFHDQAVPLSLLLIDVDHFKAVNDAHGHPVGDAVLRQITETCMTTLRASDLFARLGGEEFAALLPRTPLAEAIQIGERLRAAVEALVVATTGGPIRVTASFGCVTATEAFATIDQLIKQADDRLYAAKRAGRNRVSPVAAPVAA
jgi:diguanylate cyclase (GGDEF)-like protein